MKSWRDISSHLKDWIAGIANLKRRQQAQITLLTDLVKSLLKAMEEQKEEHASELEPLMTMILSR